MVSEESWGAYRDKLLRGIPVERFQGSLPSSGHGDVASRLDMLSTSDVASWDVGPVAGPWAWVEPRGRSAATTDEVDLLTMYAASAAMVG